MFYNAAKLIVEFYCFSLITQLPVEYFWANFWESHAQFTHKFQAKWFRFKYLQFFCCPSLRVRLKALRVASNLRISRCLDQHDCTILVKPIKIDALPSKQKMIRFASFTPSMTLRFSVLRRSLKSKSMGVGTTSR